MEHNHHHHQGQEEEVYQQPHSPEPYDLVRVHVPRATRTAGYFNYTYDDWVWSFVCFVIVVTTGCGHAYPRSLIRYTHKTHTQSIKTAKTPPASTPGRPNRTNCTSASPGSRGDIPVRCWTWCWSRRSIICRYEWIHNYICSYMHICVCVCVCKY